MQGTAADLIKLAMLAVQKALDDEGKGTRMVMQVHDELVFEVPAGGGRLGASAEIPKLMAGRGAVVGAADRRGGCRAELGRGALR